LCYLKSRTLESIFMPSNNSSPASTNKIALGLYGAGGFAREVMQFARECLSISEEFESGSARNVYFIETTPQAKEVNGVPVISEDEFFELKSTLRLFNVAISDSKIRERIAKSCVQRGAKPYSLHSPHSIIYGNNEVGEGAIVCANSIITSNAKIGRFFHSNIYSYVAHDCVVGDFVTFAPRVHCNGNVHILDHAYIGTCAVIKQGTSSRPLVIGEGAVVGMGAIVTKDVPAHTTVVGNPARPLTKL
jgi:sugar O-acyltransferase (sialic acid O-acetyltransferase NeuD family)